MASYSEKTVEDGVNSLRDKKLATVFFGAGARVQKYRHNLPDHLTLERREEALLCVLLLRGPQTPGELRARTERMCAFGSSEEVESCLAELAKGDSALIHCLPARAGQKERRYIELLSRTVDSPEPGAIEKAASPAPSRLDMLEKEVADLKGEFRRLTEAFDAFRKQFD